MLKERANVINNFLIVADILIALISINLALYFWLGSISLVNDKDYMILILLIVIFWFLLAKGLGISIIFRSRPYSAVLFNCFGLVSFGTILLAISIFLLNLFHLGIKLLLLFAVLDLVLTFFYKVLVYSYLKKARKKGLNTLNLLVIGDHNAKGFLRQILMHQEWGYRVVALIGPDSLQSEFGDYFPFLSQDTDVEQLLRDKTIDEVILIKENAGQNEVEKMVEICSEVGVIFRMYSPFFNMLANKTHLQYFGTLPMLTISSTSINYLELKAKRVMDSVFSFLALLFLSPVFLIIALAIKLDSKGPVLFSQKRVGLRGRRFMVYKFRTMVTNAEELKSELVELNEVDGPVFKIANDPRITRVGRFLRKTSLDELPQFFNVFVGDMSIVGPRPPLPDEVRKYERWQLRRLSMKPGITCIWQVSGRNSVPFDEWMRMDMQYIDNWSLKLDFIIFLKTIRTVIRGDGK